jgi:hypothetical protein
MRVNLDEELTLEKSNIDVLVSILVRVLNVVHCNVSTTIFRLSNSHNLPSLAHPDVSKLSVLDIPLSV